MAGERGGIRASHKALVMLLCAVLALSVGGRQARAAVDPFARGLAASGHGSASMPTYLIAASNAPAQVKARANVVCSGTNDDQCIQAVINALPTAPSTSRSSRTVTPGKMGVLQLSEGEFNLSAAVTVPIGSIVTIKGAGVSSWIPIDPVNTSYEGGTILYSTDSTGAVLQYPKDGSGFPTTEVNLSDIELRVFNPAANVSGTALLLDGMISGVVANVNVLADMRTNTTQHISVGLSLQAGGSSSRKMLSAVNVYSFRQTGIVINTTHLTALNLSAGNIANDAFSQGIQISSDNDDYFAGLQTFGVKYGLGVNASCNTALDIASIHFEATNFPALINCAKPVYLRRIEIDTGVAWTGDITTKAQVGAALITAAPTAKAHNAGTATIASGGATTVTVTHGLFTTPTIVTITPQGTGGAGAWVSAIGATTFTINVPTAPTASTDFFWKADVTQAP